MHTEVTSRGALASSPKEWSAIGRYEAPIHKPHPVQTHRWNDIVEDHLERPESQPIPDPRSIALELKGLIVVLVESSSAETC
mmetsp:Transcript_119175/g.218297  ORF Transcript_119175/g.218297 Transcript_119175/m.218297 type:complete len:82 (-) Transcript_119175:1530-1775(-)